MSQTTTDPKQQAHDLIDQMTAEQAAAVVGVFKLMLDPVDPLERALVNARYVDEPPSEDEVSAIAEARVSLARGEGISNEGIAAQKTD